MNLDIGSWTDTSKKLFAFFGLVIINTGLLLVMALSKSKGHSYTYNPASAICMAEVVKLVLSSITYFRTNSYDSFRAALTKDLVIPYSILAFIYCANNALTFLALSLTDPGTVGLFKATTPFLTAVIQYFIYKTVITRLEWSCILLLTCGIVLTQWNDCTGKLNIGLGGLIVMCTSVTLTAISSTANAYIIKTSAKDISLPLQNIVLYGAGVFMNFQVFALSYAGFLYGSNGKGFFEGYDNPFACLVIFCSGMIGVAITFVYKYGDAVIKCFATVLSSMLLLVFSALFFDLDVTVTSISGCMIVFTASYVYMIISPELNKLLANKDNDSEKQISRLEKGHNKDDSEDASMPLMQRR
jgi:drug/metabolite transporter (DMT)-like permease